MCQDNPDMKEEKVKKLDKEQIKDILCTIRAQYFDALAKGQDAK